MFKVLKLRFLYVGFGNGKPVALYADFAAGFDHAASMLSGVCVMYHVGVRVMGCRRVIASNNSYAFWVVCNCEKYGRVQDCPPVRIFGRYAARVGGFYEVEYLFITKAFSLDCIAALKVAEAVLGWLVGLLKHGG